MSKTHYSAVELAGLPGMPSTERTVQRLALRESWPSQKRQGRGGGREYPIACLPQITRDHLIAKQLTAPVGALPPSASVAGSLPVTAPTAEPATKPSSLPVVAERAPTKAVIAAADRFAVAVKAADLTDGQRQCASARMALLDEAYALHRGGIALEAAFNVIAQNAARGILRPELQSMVALANARASEGRSLSARAMLNWHSFLKPVAVGDAAARLAALAPHIPQKALASALPPEILGVIAKLDTSGNSVAAAAREYAKENGFGRNHIEINRLYHRVARALKDKVPQAVVHKLRYTGAGLTAKKPYFTRGTKNLLPNDIWVVDGHSMKAKWAHPETGKPFVPELTVVIEWYSRRVIGWSVSLSENSLAVCEAVLKAVASEGVCGLIYSDIGAGINAGNTKALYATFGMEHENGRPGNPQGRGVIERSWASHAIEVARKNPMFRGSGVDRDTLRRNAIAVDKSIRAVKRGDANVVPFTQLPPLAQMFQELGEAFDDYNNRPHRAHPRHPGEPRHYTPNEWQAIGLQNPECAIERVDPQAHWLMYMPYIVTETKRGRVTLHKCYYGHADLYRMADGKSVRVHYDVTDPRKVWIADMDGRLICEAGLDANTRDAFPVSVVERTRLRRINNQAKRVSQKLDDLQQERDGIVHYTRQAFAAPELPNLPDVDEFDRPGEVDAEPETDNGDAGNGQPQNIVAITHAPAQAKRPTFRDPEDRYRWLMANRSAWANADVKFVAAFVDSDAYHDSREIFEREGIAWIEDDEGEQGEPDVFRGAAA